MVCARQGHCRLCTDTLQLVCTTLVIDATDCVARYSNGGRYFASFVIPVGKLKVLSDTECRPVQRLKRISFSLYAKKLFPEYDPISISISQKQFQSRRVCQVLPLHPIIEVAFQHSLAWTQRAWRWHSLAYQMSGQGKRWRDQLVPPLATDNLRTSFQCTCHITALYIVTLVTPMHTLPPFK